MPNEINQDFLQGTTETLEELEQGAISLEPSSNTAPKKRGRKPKVKQAKTQQEEPIDINIHSQLQKTKEELIFEKRKRELEALENFDKSKYFLYERQLFRKFNSLEYVPLYKETVNGLLFIGDVHAWSKKPSRRLDDFSETVLNKLNFIVDYCNDNRLLPLFKGDLFHVGSEHNIRYINKLACILKRFHLTPLIVYGNHDITETVLTESNALDLFDNLGIVHVLRDNGFAYRVDVTKGNEVKRLLIGATPYGKTIPLNVLGLIDETYQSNVLRAASEKQEDFIASHYNEKGRKSASISLILEEELDKAQQTLWQSHLNKSGIEEVIWLTHHDLAFSGVYHKCPPLRPILGVNKVVNGHIHSTELPVLVGETAYYNLGNISRLSIDTVNHIPSVWQYSPFDKQKTSTINQFQVDEFKQIIVPHFSGHEVFSLVGKHAESNFVTETQQEESGRQQFVSGIIDQKLGQTSGENDAVVLQNSLNQFLMDSAASSDAKKIVASYSHKAIVDKMEK